MAVTTVSKITASSPDGFGAAVREGLMRANKTLRGITSLRVEDMRVAISDGKITEFRVTKEVTFILED